MFGFRGIEIIEEGNMRRIVEGGGGGGVGSSVVSALCDC